MRSLLFVPADSPRKLAKALGSNADAIIVDLEDSIAPGAKAEARASSAAFVRDAVAVPERPFVCVRVNGLASGLIDADLAAIVAAQPDAIMLPKAEGAASILHADAKLAAQEAMHGIADGHTKIIAMAIESAAGFFLAGTIRRQSARLIALSWGAEDLAAELGAESNRDSAGRYTSPYSQARDLCLMAAAAAEVLPIETIYMDYRDSEGLRRDCAEARREGFAGRLAIHPAQVPIINEAFTPTESALTRARAIIAAFAASPGAGVVGIDGVMYDRPHLLRAQRLIARAKGLSGP
ncbi:MAG TPA: CoA ester lyase [Xanthobacteraceae bacterium]|nr:CoA ester lyase [Xanthobacteraceae bacterium]